MSYQTIDVEAGERMDVEETVVHQGWGRFHTSCMAFMAVVLLFAGISSWDDRRNIQQIEPLFSRTSAIPDRSFGLQMSSEFEEEDPVSTQFRFQNQPLDNNNENQMNKYQQQPLKNTDNTKEEFAKSDSSNNEDSDLPLLAGIGALTAAVASMVVYLRSALWTSSEIATTLAGGWKVLKPNVNKKDKKKKIMRDYGIFDYGYFLQDPKIPLPSGVVEGAAPQSFPITQAMVETLERDGVVHVPGVLSKEWVEYLRECTMHQVENPHIWSFAGTASKLYDYIQRNVWQTNKGFQRFFYQSPAASVIAQVGQTESVRIATDLLMVNPNRGFKWHQDNQNGPITFEDGIRFWITMDDTPVDYGAPVYLKGSQKNDTVEDSAVFVDINNDDLSKYKDKMVKFEPKAGDMLIWHPRCIHKIDGPKSGVWTQYRRVLGGTAAKAGTRYVDKRGSGGVFSDLGKHSLEDGQLLESAFFPQIYPHAIDEEVQARDRGEVQRDVMDMPNKVGGLFSKMAAKKFGSWFDVVGSTNDDASA